MTYNRFKDTVADALGDYMKSLGLVRQRPHPFVVAGLLGQIGEQVRQAHDREAQEATLARAVEQDLSHSQAHQLSVGDPRIASGTRSTRQDFISENVKCDQEGVEIGGHAATSTVDVDISNADLRHPSYGPSPRPGHRAGTESVI